MMRGSRRYKTSKRRRQVYLKKLALVLSVIMIATGLGVTLSANLVSAHDNAETTQAKEKCYRSIEIASGDTLWDIAEEYMSDDYESVQDYVGEIKMINGLLEDNIYEGEYLMVPYYEAV